jgi:hypothetical protein
LPLVILLALIIGEHGWGFLNVIRVKKPVMGGFVTIYIASRLYIIITLFISLRSQPEEIYAAVNWSKYIPHLN